ncbi:MAG: nickel/cobalt transporter [Spirochaetota bacterium]
MIRARAVLLVAYLVIVAGTVAAQNPFTSNRESEQAVGVVSSGSTPQLLRDWSRSLQARIAGLSREVAGGRWSAAVSAFLLSVLFGMVHIAGPGHGKAFAISFFSGRRARPRDGVLYSAVVNLVDSLSAFLLVLLGYVLLRAVLPSFRTDGPRILEIVSYSAIVVFGVAHLVSHLREGHDHSSVGSDPRASRPPWLLALSVGLVPCPVSTILLVFGVANDALALMVVMVIGVSIGGFLIMSVIAIAVITGRERLLGRLRGDRAERVAEALEFVASGAIIAVGVLLLVAAL